MTLFFTAGTGLVDWDRGGNLERELAVYRKLAGNFGPVNLVSYGGKGDREYDGRLPEFKVCPSVWRRRQGLTALEVAIRHCSILARSDFFKTNQMRGAQIPVWLKRLFGKPLIVRCGFLHGYFTEKQTTDPRLVAQAHELEKRAFHAADLIFLTSAWQRTYVMERYGLDSELVSVVPNYVQTGHFRTLPEVQKKYDLVFVGRGGEQKNLAELLKALHLLKQSGREVRVLLAGSCNRNEQLVKMVEKYTLAVDFAGQVATARLPEVLNSARAFILPSHYEGHPKALLEAMSCALPCIGADVDGIGQEISHGQDGYLCQTDAESIAEAISTVLGDSELSARIAVGARATVESKFSLEQVVEIESSQIRRLLDAR